MITMITKTISLAPGRSISPFPCPNHQYFFSNTQLCPMQQPQYPYFSDPWGALVSPVASFILYRLVFLSPSPHLAGSFGLRPSAANSSPPSDGSMDHSVYLVYFFFTPNRQDEVSSDVVLRRMLPQRDDRPMTTCPSSQPRRLELSLSQPLIGGRCPCRDPLMDFPSFSRVSACLDPSCGGKEGGEPWLKLSRMLDPAPLGPCAAKNHPLPAWASHLEWGR